MHPDLHLKIYEQRERELEQRLRTRRAVRERADAGSIVHKVATPRLAGVFRQLRRMGRLVPGRGPAEDPGAMGCVSS